MPFCFKARSSYGCTDHKNNQLGLVYKNNFSFKNTKKPVTLLGFLNKKCRFFATVIHCSVQNNHDPNTDLSLAVSSSYSGKKFTIVSISF